MVEFKYRKTRLDFARINLNEAALVLLWTEERLTTLSNMF